ncbi:MAG: GNAT family N-acetyltransferase [Bacteroidetes bacterium]|nr:MAG: GNAT family N-acetyltransferase [Bacteroidota bacterium]MBL1143624.1 GNAT family N-acetyltransferase [Bacteroidota bacterium]NOG56426.1 GNAT family N-acetyltransferase [Bacteroidota bacterium]
MMNKKELFQKFSLENEAVIPFSLHFNWWNEVVQNNWDVAVVSNDNQVFAVWPYFIRKKGIWNLITQPHFTPYSGIYIRYPEGQKVDTKIAFEKKLIEELITQLPDFSEWKQNFHLEFKNSLPLIWNGFEDQKRFTYILPLTESIESIFLNFRDNIKKQIRKAEKFLIINEAEDSKKLKQAFESSFEAQNLNSPIDDSMIFQRIYEYIKKHQLGKVWNVMDQEGNLHAAMCLVWDQHQAYYLIGGAMKEFKNSGAMSLLMWHAIQNAKTKQKNKFNFEGSSIEAIEKYLRGFGGELTPFTCIYKSNSSSLQLAKKIKKHSI